MKIEVVFLSGERKELETMHIRKYANGAFITIPMLKENPEKYLTSYLLGLCWFDLDGETQAKNNPQDYELIAYYHRRYLNY